MNQPDHSEILVNVFGRTDVGRTREHNEDAFVVADLSKNDASLQPSVRRHRVGPKGTLFMVADGMGGAAAGEIASQMATEIVLRELRANWLAADGESPEHFATCLKRAAQSANQAIHGYASSHQEFRGMGTTATIAGLLADTLYLCQIGDSRGYLVRDGVAKQITKDQSLMQKLIEAGELTEEEAAQSERRNIILQALGPEANIKVDLTFQRLRRGDVLVLCSDGLSGQVTRDQIGEVIRNEPDLVSACKKLIDLANQAGGPDNITVICARFEGGGLNDMEIEGDEVGHKVFAVNDGGSTPPMAMDRVFEVPTQPMRASGDRATTPVDQPAIEAEEPEIVTDSQDPVSGATADIDMTDVAAVAPERRSKGKIIAGALLVLLLALASWFAVKMMGGSSAPDSAAVDSAVVADSTQPALDSAARPADSTRPPSDSVRPTPTRPQ
jgi:serine/threonine protein phosphatase PrpC